MIRTLGFLACGAVLGVVGCVVWFVWYMTHKGGLWR